MSVEPDDRSDFDDFCESAEDDEFEAATLNCSLDQHGHCGQAGSEHCEFECPFRNSGFRTGRRKKQHRAKRSRTAADHEYLRWKAFR